MPATRVVTRSRAIATSGNKRVQVWIENQDPADRTGTAIGWVRRYQAADGQLYALLLSTYLFLTLLPLLVVFSTYVYDDPLALAHRLESRMRLEAETSKSFDAIMSGAADHRFSALVIALINAFFFGLGFGRVLQAAHARSWGFDMRKRAIVDQLLYLEVLGVLSAMALLFVVQTKALADVSVPVAILLDVAWVVAVLAYFTYAPWRLLGGRVALRDVLPGAVLIVLGLAGARLVSAILLRRWLEYYSGTFGGLGLVMGLFFWLIVLATIIVLGAAFSPALAHRRDLRAARAC